MTDPAHPEAPARTAPASLELPPPPAWHSPLTTALGWVLPLSCVGCQLPDDPLCDTCFATAAASAPPPVTLPDGTRVFAGSAYADEARRAIVAFKTEGFTVIDLRLAALLETALVAATNWLCDPDDHTPDQRRSQPRLAAVRERDGHVTRRRPVLFVPVPSSRRGFRARGYRPVDRVLSRTDRLATPALAYARQPVDQIGLGVHERDENMRGSMCVTRRVEGRSVVIVDDVSTTGATIGEAAAVLRAAGARRVAAAVIAATPRRSLSAQPGRSVGDFSGVGDYGGAKGVEEPPELFGGTPYRGGRCGN